MISFSCSLPRLRRPAVMVTAFGTVNQGNRQIPAPFAGNPGKFQVVDAVANDDYHWIEVYTY